MKKFVAIFVIVFAFAVVSQETTPILDLAQETTPILDLAQETTPILDFV